MIPYGKQYIDEDDIAAVTDVLRGDYLTTGPAVTAFEEAFAAQTGARYAVSCANGTAALHLAMLALDMGPGDAAIVPGLTFLATANAVRFTGAEVIFADVDPMTGLMGAEQLSEAMTRCGDMHVKACLPVHLTGECADLKSLKQISAAHDMHMIADSCHAVGGLLDDAPVGACISEDMAAFSFHPVKTMTMGEGGAVTTNNEHYAQAMKRLRTHGMVPCAMAPEIPNYYEMHELGYNYRASDIQCALGLSQLKKLPAFVSRRRALSALYDEKLAPLAPLVSVPSYQPYNVAARHLYAVRIDFTQAGITRAAVMEKLLAAGVGTQVHYYPVHRQPYYQDRYGSLSLPGADEYYRGTLSLPLYYGMEDDDVEFIVSQLTTILGRE